MEFNQENRSFCSDISVLDTVAEQLADIDLTLPDYCPDIEKILKCTLTPKIQTKSLSGGQLQIEGYCIVNVLYVESINKTVRCCEQNVNFSQNFSIKETPDNPVIITKTKSEYINCRALSPRRLVMHGAFSLYVKVLGSENRRIYTPDNELEAYKKTMQCASLKSLCQEQFNVCEEISIGEKPAIESMLYSDVGVSLTDIKSITGKLIINGEISLKMLYLTDVESGATGKMDYLLPFNQIIDCDGVDENTINCVNCEILSYDIRLKNEMLSEKPAVVLDVKLCVTEQGYVINEENVIVDAYSVKFNSKPEFEQLNVINEIIPVTESFMEKLSVKVDDGKISKVLDIYSDFVSVDCNMTDKGVKLSGKISVCMLALNSENAPVFIERISDYEHYMNSVSDCNSVITPEARAVSISYRLADDSTVELRCEIKVNATAQKKALIKAVKDVEVYEDSPVNTDDCALTLYFANKGESLWNIAKEHKTCLDMLLEENSAESEILDSPQMLLIPRI